MIFSDEKYFYLSIPPKNRNHSQWAELNHCLGVETPLNDPKILIWCTNSDEKTTQTNTII